jgi:pimeloyl-ACP methyl ester carboxylesterase
MATYVLIHGAGDVGWFWHLVAAELRERGHDVVAPDLPCDDDSAGLSEYTDAVIDAIGGRTQLVVVAQSFAGSPRRSCATGRRWSCWCSLPA